MAPISRRIRTNGIELHVLTEGPEDAPLVVLLHGFPEYSGAWSRYFEPLVAAGFRVWAPDQRGYNTSDRPPRVSDYVIDELALDVVGLLDAAGVEDAVVAGHDWGAAVAWWLAVRHPERVRKLFIVNVPHPAVMLRGMPKQLRKSWYILMFQLPWVAERLARAKDFRLLEGALKTALPGTFSAQELEEYRRVWSQPGALTSMINWYRAAVRQFGRRLGDVRVRVPVEIVWGVNDAALSAWMAPQSAALCDDVSLHMIDDATHWINHEKPELVLEHLLEFAR